VARTRRSRRPRLTIGLLVLASITIITLDYRGDAHGEIASLKSGASDAFSPVQRGVDAVTHPIGSFLAGAFNGGELEQENNKLRLANSRLEQQVLTGQARADALKALQKLEHLPWASNIATVTAQVINRSPSNFVATIELDTGTADGVEDGMPVVGSGGLVGQVTATSTRTCTVQLITNPSPDPQVGVGVTFGSSAGNQASVQGRGIGKPLDVNLIVPGTALQKGEVLTTSGLPDLVYPPGIPVARITHFSSTSSASQVSVTAEPTADLNQLAYVDVLQWQPAS
jgi:rod shape-determining protein MreC